MIVTLFVGITDKYLYLFIVLSTIDNGFTDRQNHLIIIHIKLLSNLDRDT